MEKQDAAIFKRAPRVTLVFRSSPRRRLMLSIISMTCTPPQLLPLCLGWLSFSAPGHSRFGHYQGADTANLERLELINIQRRNNQAMGNRNGGYKGVALSQ